MVRVWLVKRMYSILALTSIFDGRQFFLNDFQVFSLRLTNEVRSQYPLASLHHLCTDVSG